MATKRTTPVFIISYNRLTYLRRQVLAFEAAGFQDIIILDNRSTYEPLLSYLDDSPHHVVHMDANYGHLVLWRSGRFDRIVEREAYVLTDCDVVPSDDCPDAFFEILSELLQRNPEKAKVGLSLRIDDLPDRYRLKHKVVELETRFCGRRRADGHYDAPIDTTFALYRPGVRCDDPRWWKAIRTSPPFCATHLPWYEDSDAPTEEQRHYVRSALAGSTYWTAFDAVRKRQEAGRIAAREPCPCGSGSTFERCHGPHFR